MGTLSAGETGSVPERIGDLAVRLFGPSHGVDLVLPERAPHQRVRVSSAPAAGAEPTTRETGQGSTT